MVQRDKYNMSSCQIIGANLCIAYNTNTVKAEHNSYRQRQLWLLATNNTFPFAVYHPDFGCWF